MRAVLIALLLCLPFAGRAENLHEAQALEDQGRELLGENRFQPALEKLEAANLLQPTPERLLAIAQCHRELAYARLREAARLNSSEAVMTKLAESLGELDAGRAGGPYLREPQPMPPAAIEARRDPHLAPRGPEPELSESAHPATTVRLVTVAGIGSLVLLAASGAAYLHASSITGGLSDPNTPDKAGLQREINTYQTGSNMLLGAGLLLGAVTAGLLIAHF